MIVDLDQLTQLKIGSLVFIIQKKFIYHENVKPLEHVGCLNCKQYGLIPLGAQA
jgi:hypothetical protein